MKCKVCDNQLSVMNRSEYCGDACKKQKERLVKGVNTNLQNAKLSIRKAIQGLDLGGGEHGYFQEDVDRIHELLRELAEAEERAFQRRDKKGNW